MADIDRSQLAIGYGTREGDSFNTMDATAFDAGLGIELAYAAATPSTLTRRRSASCPGSTSSRSMPPLSS